MSIKAREGAYLGPLVSWEHLTKTLPKSEKLVYNAIMGRLMAENPGQFIAIEMDIFEVSKQIGLKHQTVSDAVRSLTRRHFHVAQGHKKVFEYPLIIIHGYHIREVGKPIESIMVSVAHETAPRDDASESWTKGETFGEEDVDRLAAEIAAEAFGDDGKGIILP